MIQGCRNWACHTHSPHQLINGPALSIELSVYPHCLLAFNFQIPVSKMPEKKPLREPGRLESYYEARARLGFLGWVVVSARYQHRDGGTLDRSTLFTALERVVHGHVALTARLDSNGSASDEIGAPVWVRLPVVDLNKIVEFHDEDSSKLENILETFYASPISYSEDVPPWKLFVLRDGTVSFAYEHTFGDGQSGIAFHVALLSALHQIQAPPAKHSGILTAFPDDATLVAPIEERMDVSVPISTIVEQVSKVFLPSFMRKDTTQTWTGEPVPASAVYGMTIRILQYSPADASRLLQLSRAHGTTATGTLHTLALIVLTRLLRARPDTKHYTSIATNVPISLRRFTGTPPTAFCTHVSALRDTYPFLVTEGGEDRDHGAAMSADKFPWDRAVAFTTALKREAPRSGTMVGTLKLLFGKYDGYLLGQLGKKRSGGLELSNLGPFPVDKVEKPPAGAWGAGWSASEVVFAQADPTLSCALVINAAGAPDGGLGLVVSWGKGAVDMGLAQEFLTEFKAGVQALIASADGKP
ncbi:alcohol acetyltransferase [Trametes meyenii]|nr:alcohol acetyltransferase [Trametes meyenii]